MSYPPGMMRRRNLTIQKLGTSLGRLASGLLGYRLMPGKLRPAALLLVANERTRAAVPRPARGKRPDYHPGQERGRLDIWSVGQRTPSMDRPFGSSSWADCYWKAVISSSRRSPGSRPRRRPAWRSWGWVDACRAEEQTRRLGLDDRVHFAGTQPQTECAARLRALDALVLPSLYECGGAVVLEAMASGLPVIATAWGGPLDYLDESCGVPRVSGFPRGIRLGSGPGDEPPGKGTRAAYRPGECRSQTGRAPVRLGNQDRPDPPDLPTGHRPTCAGVGSSFSEPGSTV